ncbi:thiol-disulfide oxidoreductase DCC family protein [Thiorhodococcus minor]|uniref:DUF393 domain-containing protein n=1 Tax=Thiorhodococcus minor TaxID=57489 RepID=A0A6M0JY03_9GAMM|nr:DUF393 domain-containing protein [Thiorhodococcus minor]NEV61237.1 DUF393 domain-containing protein [Thiorhodococcus minor]
MTHQTSTTETPPALCVLYDGGCPVCRREIAHYQGLRPLRPVEWVDIHADPQAPERLGVTWEAAMARFHVFEGERARGGAAAFLLLWSAMPGWRHLASIVRTLRLQGLLERGYSWFAERRLGSRCTEASCDIQPPDADLSAPTTER